LASNTHRARALPKINPQPRSLPLVNPWAFPARAMDIRDSRPHRPPPPALATVQRRVTARNRPWWA